jgi:hypothetical protein
MEGIPENCIFTPGFFFMAEHARHY